MSVSEHGDEGGGGGSGEQSEPHSPNRKVWLVGAWHTSVAPQYVRPELLQLIWFPLPVQPQRSGCGHTPFGHPVPAGVVPSHG